MADSLRITLCQLNMLVGDIEGNTEKILTHVLRARDEQQAQLVVFPELALSGYPPEDLLLRPGFHKRVAASLEHLAHSVSGIDVIVGHSWRDEQLYNAASLLRNGERVVTYYKQCLPNYGVFDEKRYFSPGTGACVVDITGVSVGITICEDIWEPGPMARAVDQGAELIINLNASPFHIGKERERAGILKQRTDIHGVPIAYVNLVGGQDELVFDGASFVVDAGGDVMCRAARYQEDIMSFVYGHGCTLQCEAQNVCDDITEEESIYQALILGVRDYVEKNGFPGVIIGLSGGIDSALTLIIAVDALGSERVEVIMMPSRHTSDMSVEDAKKQASALGVQYHVVSIEPMYESFIKSLSELFVGKAADTTEENIQARIRGTLLMAQSNKSGKMVLTTGNKSEMAVGYATLYGDMAGGFAAIKDLPKTLVYRLAHYRNTLSEAIPRRVIERPPSAELAPGQKDTDALPEYDVLDEILARYIEQDQCVEDIVAAGFDVEIVSKVTRMVDVNEYKRRQAAPGVRISERAFGRDRRYPITSGYGRTLRK
ncbi:MAG: NAD+ synthase [Gammaproteobacteria bacterium]|nr:MAG: NAD+ synthase [Gammaproteobacteria bacterium]